MDVDPQNWLLAALLAVAVSFALGWLASRLDLRQWRRTDRSASKAYFKGLNLLLNEQHDKAIDVFIQAVQDDPDTSELHFALGNLFRRRGEFERAIRVHEHLLQRADLTQADRQRAQHALAQDFMKAGLLDRAEQAYGALAGSPFDTEARLALLSLAERSRDWSAALELALRLEKSGAGSFAQRIAHYHCELASQAEAGGDTDTALAALQRAQACSPQAARPLVALAEQHQRQGRMADALSAYRVLRQRNPEAFARVAGQAVACAEALLQGPALRAELLLLFDDAPGIELLRALARLEGSTPGASARLLPLLRAQPSLSAAIELLDTPCESWPEGAAAAVRDAVAKAARPVQRYRCAACGFEAQHHFWQCPGCLSWDSFPPKRIDEL